MPTIYDNIENVLGDELKNAFETAYKADLCVGYFNLRGWTTFAKDVDNFAGGDDAQCRLIIGMQPTPQQLIKHRYAKNPPSLMDNQTAHGLKRELAEDFRTQLTVGFPKNTDETTLKQLADQLRTDKLKIRLFVAHPLHAKLYLIHRHDKFSPILSYLGSSNLTFSGLSAQGELNVDIPDKDAAAKLVDWFEARWNARFCLDISQELIDIIDESWAMPKLPYYIYLKMVYHLSSEVREGFSEFKIPYIFQKELLAFQAEAVKIAAHYVTKRKGVLIGDVVGLGKTMTATALIKLFDEDFGFETLILCPKNLTQMWEDYAHRYGISRVKVLSQSRAIKELPNLRRYRLVVIDESHNLRNRDGKIYKAIADYIHRNHSKVVLLSATPYNKSYADLSGQLALFIDDEEDLGISPETYIREMGGHDEFKSRFQLYSATIVEIIDQLNLPRYGLLDDLNANLKTPATVAEQCVIENLTRAGKRLKGFARTNLFKRLESGGEAFLLSIYRHIMRNALFSYALKNEFEIPIGQQESALLDSFITDETDLESGDFEITFHSDLEKYETDAALIYEQIKTTQFKKFDWLRSDLFNENLALKLTADSEALNYILQKVPQWLPENDRKLQALRELITVTYSDEKILIFTQFADTADYLERYFKKLGVCELACVTGKNKNPTEIACRFSPKSNQHKIKPEDELRILITTDVLSEGQNLQDAHIVVNYDLPWAIIRLIQRAGRVDRIGQKAETILCYSFLPEEGVEKIIKLRTRLMQRIEQNADVVGSDEQFFDGDPVSLHDLYSEKNNIFDEYEDEEIDLPSFAQQIWNDAIAANPKLKTIIPNLPNVVYSAKSATEKQKTGVIVYAKTANDNDLLTWLNDNGDIITQSQFAILNAAACSIDTPRAPRSENHHELISQNMTRIHQMDSHVGGQLGKKNSTRYQIYHRLKTYCEFYASDIFLDENVKKAIDDIYKHPLHEMARESLSRQLKTGTNDVNLVDLVLHLREESKLSRFAYKNNDETFEPSVICSLGIV